MLRQYRAGILMRGGNTEILETNDNFYVQLGMNRQEYFQPQKHIFQRFDEQNRALP